MKNDKSLDLAVAKAAIQVGIKNQNWVLMKEGMALYHRTRKDERAAALRWFGSLLNTAAPEILYLVIGLILGRLL